MRSPRPAGAGENAVSGNGTGRFAALVEASSICYILRPSPDRRPAGTGGQTPDAVVAELVDALA